MLEKYAADPGRPHLFSLRRMAGVDYLKQEPGLAVALYKQERPRDMVPADTTTFSRSPRSFRNTDFEGGCYIRQCPPCSRFDRGLRVLPLKTFFLMHLRCAPPTGLLPNSISASRTQLSRVTASSSPRRQRGYIVLYRLTADDD